MIFYYLDSSAWIKRYCLEDGSQWVADFFASGPAIACSALGLIEVLCTFARKHKANELSVLDCRKKSREARRDFALFHRIFFTEGLLDVTADLSEIHALRGADTVHLSAALYLRDKMSVVGAEVKMVTADNELATAAKRVELDVFYPADGTSSLSW